MGNKLSKIARQAAAVRADANLRHFPSPKDIETVNENAKSMWPAQLATIEPERDDDTWRSSAARSITSTFHIPST
jgi:hypothetical protein